MSNQIKLNSLIDAALLRQGAREMDVALTPRKIRGRFITMKWPGKCSACKAELAVGTKAAWYGFGKVYGLKCHKREDK